MTKSYADECLERAEKATEGPWEVINTQLGSTTVISSQLTTVFSDRPNTGHKVIGPALERDSQFIAHARTDVPELARRLKRAIAVLRVQCTGVCMEIAEELERMPSEEK